MERRLLLRVVPEVDDRAVEREAADIASTFQQQLDSLDPLDAKNDLVNVDSMFEDIEKLKDMAAEMGRDMFLFEQDGIEDMEEIVDTFSESMEILEEFDNDSFAMDVLFGEGLASTRDMSASSNNQMMEGLTQTLEEVDLFDSEGIAKQLSELSDTLALSAQNSGRAAALIGGLSTAFKLGAATVAVGGLALFFLNSIWGSVKGISSTSPLLESVVSILGMTMKLFLRPIATEIGKWLLPLAVSALELAVAFNKFYNNTSLGEALLWLGGQIFDAIFSLEGIFVIAVTTLGGILGAAIGAKAGALLGAKLGALLGSVFGPLGTLAGALVGGALGATIGFIASLLFAANFPEAFDAVRDLLGKIKTFILDLVFAFFDILFWVSQIPFKIAELIEAFPGWLASVASKFAERVKEIFGELVTDVANIDVSGLAGKIKDKFFDILPDIPDLDIVEKVMDLWPGWPRIPQLTWGTFIPNINWNISGFDWGTFIPKISWNIPDWPGWKAIANFLSGGGITAGMERTAAVIESSSSGSSTGADPSLGSTESVVDGGVEFRTKLERQLAGLVGLAGGGIVTSPTLALIGEGTEPEAVTPISELRRFIDSERNRQPVARLDRGNRGVGFGSDIARELENAIGDAEVSINDAALINKLDRVQREIRLLRDEMDLDVRFEDASKWEVRK